MMTGHKQHNEFMLKVVVDYYMLFIIDNHKYKYINFTYLNKLNIRKYLYLHNIHVVFPLANWPIKASSNIKQLAIINV